MLRTTVVIPNYNGIKYIKDCLDSLLLSDTEIKIIVVDNASTDGSYELIRDSYPMVKLIRLKKNTGFAFATNRGILEAATDFVFLLNNDTKVIPNTVSEPERAISNLYDAFSVQALMVRMSNPNIVDSAGDYYCVTGWASAYGKDKFVTDIESGIYKIFSACAGAAIYRRAAMNVVGMLDSNHFAYLEDVDLGYRAMLKGYKNYIDTNATVFHAGSATSGSRYNDFKVKLSARNNIYLIYKNMPTAQLIINAPFLALGFAIKVLFFHKKGMGKQYISGLRRGIRLCNEERAKRKKVPFELYNLENYIRVELLLFANLLKYLG